MIHDQKSITSGATAATIHRALAEQSRGRSPVPDREIGSGTIDLQGKTASLLMR
jgi:hypothetical protein